MLDAMQAGADDYVVKPFDDLELKARLLVGKRILNLQEELVAARESMRHAATHDSLTGLMNRGEILGMLERELERARREHKPIGVVLGDIDHFKSVNDTFGHLFGDEALREIGRRLRAQLRVYDGVGRYGGEEFLMVLPNCDMPNALLRADELRQIIGGTPVLCSGAEKSITMSMGVTVSESDSKNEIEVLLNQADASLYSAKEKGRNRIEQFTPAAKKAMRARKG
jgi:diguanylate cyclase (GGDEF)-like protein